VSDGDLVWDGSVVEVDGDIFTVDLRREGGPDMMADYSMKECGITVEPGDLLIVRPDSVTKREPRVWTREELDAIMARARKRAALLKRIAG
jgi:hypothetical protein